ncbi:MAG: membrane associated rhomboid family serine protease [Halieaceae bacterium]|jgi:membrane associated rhomboid family serine protease
MSSHPTWRHTLTIALTFVALLWLIKLVEFFLGLSLHNFGVYPRSSMGLIGITTGPLIHGSWQHLFGNSPPLVLLGSMLIYGYPKSRYWALAGIWLMSGIGVWLFARSSFHFGASGITHGVFFYLFIGGILRRDKRSAAILMVAFYLYGGMLLTILPGDPGVSFESHFFGALSGAVFATLFRHWDPLPTRRRYSWERRPGVALAIEEEDPIIGEQWRGEPDSDLNSKSGD